MSDSDLKYVKCWLLRGSDILIMGNPVELLAQAGFHAVVISYLCILEVTPKTPGQGTTKDIRTDQEAQPQTRLSLFLVLTTHYSPGSDSEEDTIRTRRRSLKICDEVYTRNCGRSKSRSTLSTYVLFQKINDTTLHPSIQFKHDQIGQLLDIR
ncbi:hypothetical protein C8Q75DRAFT_730257 [Abortiporus biennis]|nr:hypothetical protein C8Q75DRAFT_730257 [Abortiporus biennis]